MSLTLNWQYLRQKIERCDSLLLETPGSLPAGTRSTQGSLNKLNSGIRKLMGKGSPLLFGYHSKLLAAWDRTVELGLLGYDSGGGCPLTNLAKHPIGKPN